MTSSPQPNAGRIDLISGFAGGLFVLFLAELLLGLLLETRYEPTTSGAYASVSAIQSGGMWHLRSFHYWASAILIAGSLAALIWMLFAKWFNGGHNRMWLAVAILYLTSLLSQISGNLLPFDRHGVETAVVESGVAGRTPIVGSPLQKLIIHGTAFNDPTIGVWHFAHLAFWALGAVAAVLFWFGSKGQERNRVLVWSPFAFAVALSFMAKAPLGNQATAADYGRYDAQVSWYTWPLHGSLNLFSHISSNLGWVGSAAIPGLFALFIVAAPYASRRFSAKTIQGTFVGFGAYFLIAGLVFGGRFAPLIGNRDPAETDPAVSTLAAQVDPILYAKGRDLFNSNACEGCHGMDGRSGAGAESDRRGAASRYRPEVVHEVH